MSKPIRIRASSLAQLFDCSHSWEGTHILGLRKPTSGAAHLGTAIHAGTAEFDHGLMMGNQRAREAVDVTIAALHEGKSDVDWGDLRMKDAETIGATLVSRYCADDHPQEKIVSVEMELKPLVIEVGDGISIELTGTMDRARLRADGEGMGIKDIKTGERAVDSYGRAVTKGHAGQIGVYEILAENTLGVPVNLPAVIVGMRTAKSNPGIGTGEIHNAKANLVGTPDDPGLLDFAADMLKAGRFPPNVRSQLCSPKWCARWATCKYHP